MNKIIKNSFFSLKLQRTKKGSVLVFALIVLSFILVTAFSLSAVSLIEKRSSGVSVNSSTAFQNSDEGMEKFLQQLYKELDQNDTLNNVATALEGGYKCYGKGGQSISIGSPARIGNQKTEFIITAYREKPNASDTTSGTWNSVEPIEDCDTKLADVSRFRATGNYNNASRAVFLKLKDSLSRGLVAHWAFEDRAQNARLAVNGGDKKNSFIANDSSPKNNYTLTLCNIYSDDEVKVNMGDVNGDGNDDFKYLVEFSKCNYDNSAIGMNPFKYDSTCSSSHEDSECSKKGAWKKGIVNEDASGGNILGNNDTKEALYFDGINNYLTALIDSKDCRSSGGCDSTVNYVKDTNQLELDEGIAISAWVKLDGSGPGSKMIVSKWYGDEGYQLYIKDADKVCFKLNVEELCESSSDVSSWANIVIIWRKVDGDMKIFVNGSKLKEKNNIASPINSPSDVPVSIGAQLDDSGTANNFFEGTIDDVRIWNRALTEDEIMRLCTSSVGDTNDDGNCDIP